MFLLQCTVFVNAAPILERVSILKIQLGDGIFDMELYCVESDPMQSCNLRVAETVAYELNDTPFGRRQYVVVPRSSTRTLRYSRIRSRGHGNILLPPKPEFPSPIALRPVTLAA